MSREFHDSQKPTDLGRETTDLDETYLDREGFLPREEEEEAEKQPRGIQDRDVGREKSEEEKRRNGEEANIFHPLLGLPERDTTTTRSGQRKSFVSLSLSITTY